MSVFTVQIVIIITDACGDVVVIFKVVFLVSKLGMRFLMLMIFPSMIRFYSYVWIKRILPLEKSLESV